MLQLRSFVAIPAVLALALAMSGCGAATTSSSPAATASPSAVSTPGPAATAKPSADALRADTIEELPGAVVQIETTGTFRDPDVGTEALVGRGSGFIVDPSGIVVTNNHVVTGADSITVWVGAERAEHDAKILGASECSDLAVVRIEGGPFPYLGWYEGEIQPGLDIYVAGFPLGDPEFTLSKGIVSRAHGVLDEPWASVTNSIEHDANSNPGSSGGPVVTGDGRVVAVHYAGNRETRQEFAISRDEVTPILDDLVAGSDIASIGINGTAFGAGILFDDAPSGIWVSSVEPGSPAAKAGIAAGDMLTTLESKPLAADGTMNEYCDILRAHDAADEVPFTAYREDSRETLEGALNGSPVVPGFAFATALGAGAPEDPTPLAFEDSSDDAGRVSFETPAAWDDILDQAWSFGGEKVGPGVIVSPDVKAFKGGWKTPGVFVAASDTLGDGTSPDELLDAERPRFERSCTLDRRDSFARGGYAGSYDLWTACDDTATQFLTLAAVPEDGGDLVYLQFQAATPEDLAVLDRVLATLEVQLAAR